MFPRRNSVITTHLTFIMKVEVAFQPLNKLQVILIFTFTQFFYIDVLLDFALGKSLLQNLVVCDKLPFVFSTPVYT